MPSSKKAPRCGVEGCRAKANIVENGLTYCRNGHLQEGRVEQSQEFEDINLSASQTTRIRDTEKARLLAAKIEAQGGFKGLELFVLLYQDLLQKQCVRLQKEHGFPAQHEVIVNELWALRLQVMYEAGYRIEESRGTDDGETEDDEEEGHSGTSPSERLPTMKEQFSLCYLAALIWRIPMTISKLRVWILREKLHYLRVEREIPQDQLSQLGRRYRNTFTARELKKEALHRTVADHCIMLERFEMTFPPLNLALVLCDYLLRLGLPQQLYVGVEGQARILEIDFCLPNPNGRKTDALVLDLPEVQLIALIVVTTKLWYPFDSQPRCVRSPDEPALFKLDWETWDSAYERREATLRATSGYAFEPGGELEVSEENVWDLTDEQTDAYVDWFQNTWLEPEAAGAAEAEEDAGSKRRKTDSDPNAIPPRILEMFPLDPPKGKKSAEAEKEAEQAAAAAESEANARLLRDISSTMTAREVVSEEAAKRREKDNRPVLRIGQQYAIYKYPDELEHCPLTRKFHERAAEAAALSLETLLKAVRRLEVKADLNKARILQKANEGTASQGRA